MCMYWREVEDESGQTSEYCRKAARSVSCSGQKDECTAGEYVENTSHIEPER